MENEEDVKTKKIDLKDLLTSLQTRLNSLSDVQKKILRKGAIGSALGLLVGLGLFFTLPMSKDYARLQTARLANAFIPLESLLTDKTKSNIQVSDKGYPQLAKNKRQLNLKQKQALIDGAAKLSLVVNGLGKSRDLTTKIITKMPNDATLTVSPYTQHHDLTVSSLRSRGFEVWLNLATQTYELDTDKGQWAISPSYNNERNLKLLLQQVENKNHIAGLSIHQKSLIPGAKYLWPVLVREIFAEGYAVFDPTKTVVPRGLFFSRRTNSPTPYFKGNVSVPDNLSIAETKTFLNGLIPLLKKEKKMIVDVTIDYPAKIDILLEWLDNIKQDSILIPLSAQSIE